MVPPLDAEPPYGKYEFLGRRCVGTVFDRFNPPSHPITLALESVHGETLQTKELMRSNQYDRYEFALDLVDGIEPREFLVERVAFYARNAYGLRGKLAIDGGSQLTLIREHFGKPRTVIFDLDFTRGGNAAQYLGEGWSGPEAKLCCNDGPRAVLTVPAALSSADRYELTISCLPFLHPPQVADQRMILHTNGYMHQASLDARHLEFFSFIFPQGALADADTAVLDFEFPDCFRPADLNVNKDHRLLAFGFKQMVLSRLLPVEAPGR
jgi:hypothetical protein